MIAKIVAKVIAKVLPLLANYIDFSFLVKIVPQLKYMDKIYKYVIDENELDIEVKAHRVELDVLKDQVITLNDIAHKLMTKGKK